MEIKIEKYICGRCGIEVICRDWSVVVRREKQCIECCGDVEMSDATLKRIAIKEGTYVKPIKVKHNKPFKVPQQPVTLRREIGKKKKKKPLTQSQKDSIAMAYDAKWDRECYGRRTYDKSERKDDE